METAGMACGTVAVVMDDGSAWFWGGAGGLGWARLLLHSDETQLKFSGVKSDGRFVLLSTRCHQNLLWEVTGPEIFLQVQEPPRTGPGPNSVEGLAAGKEKVLVRWRDGGLVSVMDVPTATWIHLHCEEQVTCLLGSAHPPVVYCGRADGSVAAFDADGSLLASWTASRRRALVLMTLGKAQGAVACVDQTGSVSVWSAVGVGGPPRLLSQCLVVDQDQQDILSADHLEEVLLLCHAHQVALWGMDNWELREQFLAPRGRSFSRAVLAPGGEVFLALLDSVPHVLVWRVGTGQCVLVLEPKEAPPYELHRAAANVVCISRHGHVTAWSSEMIRSAGVTPKMDGAVTALVVEESGGGFYSSDGSAAVWRWSLASGLPHHHFLHDGPVARLRLSPGDAHLVTLAAGDVYVWEAATGRNLVRAAGSRASDVLVTPSGQLGVSLSETWLSRVWRLTQGGVVCSVRPHLADAQVTPESTFLIGRRRGHLLAASLWSGSVSKSFSCAAGPGGEEEEEEQEEVLAFQVLAGYPDLVVVLVASGALYTWKVAEETVCRHFRLPSRFLSWPAGGISGFQMSRHGSFALLSSPDGGALHVLDFGRGALCSVRTEGPVVAAHLDSSGRYAAYVAGPAPSEDRGACRHGSRPLLQVVRLADGARVGSVRLPRNPTALLVGRGGPEVRCVFVGLGDGAVALYTVGGAVSSAGSAESLASGAHEAKGSPPHRWSPLPEPNVTWH